MKYSFLLFCIFLLAACNDRPAKNETTSKPSDEFYHYSLWAALVNKIYDGDLTVKEAKTHGDIGLGSYNQVDGELILIDGVFYQVPYTGEVKLVDDSMHIPYLNAAFFKNEFSYELNDKVNYDSHRKLIQQHFPSRNFFYAFKIHGEFDNLKLGSLHKQERPYQQGLDSLLPGRPKFDHTNISGTMVGFFCPDFIGEINVAGFHLHFLSDDKKIGGHVMEFTGKNFKVGMDKLTSYHFVLPETADFDTVNLAKKFQYGKK
ncbi:MAG: acetolactate decarboxylase [Bacteroidota bacterium]